MRRCAGGDETVTVSSPARRSRSFTSDGDDGNVTEWPLEATRRRRRARCTTHRKRLLFFRATVTRSAVLRRGFFASGPASSKPKLVSQRSCRGVAATGFVDGGGT